MRSRQLAVLGLIFLAGVFLRVYDAGRPFLWIDEITILGFGGSSRTPASIVGDIYQAAFKGPTGQHMPFQYVLLNVFLRTYARLGISSSEFLVRLPFILMGIATLPVFFVGIRRLFSASTALWATGLLAVSFFHVYQSRDATGYAPLLFFLSLQGWGVIRFMEDSPSSFRSRLASGVLVWLGASGMLFTHMTAWLYLLAQGILLGVVILAQLWKSRPSSQRAFFSAIGPMLWPALILVLSTLPFVSLVLRGMDSFNASTAGTSSDRLSWPLLVYQAAHFGWGQGGGRLAAFLLASLAGLFAGLSRKEWRARTLCLLGLILLSSAIFFQFLQRDYAPRYLSFAFLPLLVFPALGAQVITEQAAARLRLRGWAGVAPVVLFWVLLAVALAAPYRTLFGMKDKLSPFSEMRDWLVSHLPEGGLYVWRNGYNLRELPQSYPVPGRQPAFASYPNAGIPDAVLTREMNQAKSIFERFPFSVMLADAGDEKEPYWTWMRDYFARREIFRNEAVSRLWRWGLSPHGLKVVESPTYVAYYNSEADVLGRLAAVPQSVVWPIGPAWQYVQTRDGQLFVLPSSGAGTLRVRLPPGPPQTASLALLGVAMEPGSFTARPVPGTGASGSLKTASFTQGGQVELKLGPFVLPGGESQLELSQFPVDRPSLLLYAFSLSPVAEAEVGLDNRR